VPTATKYRLDCIGAITALRTYSLSLVFAFNYSVHCVVYHYCAFIVKRFGLLVRITLFRYCVALHVPTDRLRIVVPQNRSATYIDRSTRGSIWMTRIISITVRTYSIKLHYCRCWVDTPRHRLQTDLFTPQLSAKAEQTQQNNISLC